MVRGVSLFIKMKKKGELQTMETIMVVFILVVMILIGLVFFYKFTQSSIEGDYEDNQLIRFKAMMATFPEVGEIKCSINGNVDNCVDAYKMISVATLYRANPNYKNYLIERYGFMDITVGLVYPYESDENCTSQRLEGCGVWKVYSHVPAEYERRNIVSTPISVYLPEEATYGIGVMNITRYTVNV
jgi:hypothetical protein